MGPDAFCPHVPGLLRAAVWSMAEGAQEAGIPPVGSAAGCSPGAGLGLPRVGRHLENSHKGAVCTSCGSSVYSPRFLPPQIPPMPFVCRDARIPRNVFSSALLSP